MPFAVRVYENSLALINSGANAAFLWQAIDEPTEVYNKDKAWGLIDLDSNPKPVYYALKTLCSEIPVGAHIIQPPTQSATDVYAGAFLHGTRLVIGVANDSTEEKSKTIQLTGIPLGLEIVRAKAFEQIYFGSPDTEDPDIGQIVNRTLTAVQPEPGQYNIDVILPPDSTLTIVCDLTIYQGDFDIDWDVDSTDFADFAAKWLTNDNDADFDKSGTVDLSDFATFSQNYLLAVP